MIKNRKIFIAIILILILIFVWLFSSNSLQNKDEYKNYLKIRNTTLNIIISDTQELRELGLGNRKSLSDNTGMLFIFPFEDKYGFWMKDMNFPIDIFWIDSNKIIVDEISNVSTSTFPKTFFPKQNSLYVLETNAGFLQKNEIKIGDSVEFFRK
ncbi:DUF192 domain-containing protein [Candidatus Nomurabacteria bacterium]|nr:DUF192 domain-containing protein [Candidatus Nomurabacteria bacterium]